MSLHIQFKSRFASQAFFPLYNSPLHITTTLSVPFLSFSDRTPSLRSQLQSKFTFPITATQQEYLRHYPRLPNLPANLWRARRTAGILCIGPRFQPEIHSNRHPAEYTSTRNFQADIKEANSNIKKGQYVRYT